MTSQITNYDILSQTLFIISHAYYNFIFTEWFLECYLLLADKQSLFTWAPPYPTLITQANFPSLEDLWYLTFPHHALAIEFIFTEWSHRVNLVSHRHLLIKPLHMSTSYPTLTVSHPTQPSMSHILLNPQCLTSYSTLKDSGNLYISETTYDILPLTLLIIALAIEFIFTDWFLGLNLISHRYL